MAALTRTAGWFLCFQDPQKLWLRILIPLSLVLLSILVLAGGALVSQEREQVSEAHNIKLESARNFYETFVEDRTRALHLAIEPLTQSTQIRQALASRDHDQLLSLSATLFESLRQSYDITHFYFHGPDRVNILRVHQPERFGDYIDRGTAQKAETTRRMGHGVEIGPLGTYTLRVVHAVEENNQLLGYVELGKEIGHITHEIENLLGVKTIAMLSKTNLDRAGWESGMSMLGREGNWDLFDDFVLASWNTPDAAAIANLFLATVTRNNTSKRIAIGNNHFWIDYIPLIDAGGETVGRLFVIDDVTVAINNLRDKFFNTAALVIVVFVVLSGLFFLFLRRAEKKILNYQRQLVNEETSHIKEQKEVIEKLDGERFRMRHTERLANMGSWEWDTEKDLIYCSVGLCNLFHGTEEHCDLSTEDFIQNFHVDDHNLIREQMIAARDHNRSSVFECRLQSTGENIYLRGQIDPVSDTTGRTVSTYGFIRDITDEKKAETISSRLGHIFENSWEEFYLFDSETLRFLDASEGGLKNLGYSLEELREMTPLGIKPALTPGDFDAILAPLRGGEERQVTFEAVHHRKDGSSYNVDIRLQLSHESSQSIFVALVQDVTERKLHNDELKHLALYDTLTDLPNRTLLLDRIHHEITVAERQNASVAVIFTDIDQMQEVNDILGHAKGDALIKQLGDRLSATVRRSDTVARFSGDEFIIVAPGLDYGNLESMVVQIEKMLENPFHVDGATMFVRMTMGIAIYPYHGDDASLLVQRADIAKNLAKRDKIPWIVYDSEANPFSLRRLQLLTDLKDAIANGNFVLHYQPKVHLSDRELHSVEALVRWPHAKDGLIPPDDFIPLAEQSGLIAPLTNWVISEAFRQSAEWKAMGYDFKIAVNLSGRNLHDSRLVELFADLGHDHGVSPSQIVAEVTESAIMAQPEMATEVLNSLAAMGVDVSVDDYGTGYSSLSYIKSLPVSELKIDQSFIRDMVTDDDNAVIVRSTIAMAHELGLRVTAEGVEDHPVLQMLHEYGCDLVQGYYLSRPLPATELIQWAEITDLDSGLYKA